MQIDPKPLSELSLEEISGLAARFDRPGPRYTSYPTAVQFNEGFGPADYARRLQDASARPQEPISAYIHIPFCVERCTYCGCQVIPTQKRSVVESYLDHLEKEVDLAAGLLGDRRGLKVLHLGGGTPTYLSPGEIVRLFDGLRKSFHFEPGAEISVEMDPRVTTEEHIRTLRAQGANRASLGVQDFTPEVQKAIGRAQSTEETVRVFRTCREAGFEGINLDLVYGLPRQTLDSIACTVGETLKLRPDRVALYGYAHVPWMRSNQRSIDPADLPKAAERLRLFLRARDLFLGAGYLQIGMDHFALPTDDLVRAFQARRLGRNFMGYTPHMGLEIIGLGVSSIGHIAGAYAQNHKKLSTYYHMIDAGALPIERGCPCSPDDDIRRWAIHQVLCNFHLDLEAFRQQAGIPFDEYFLQEAPAIAASISDGLITRDAGGITVTDLGRAFVRNVAMALDRYNGAPAGTGARFSRTV